MHHAMKIVITRACNSRCSYCYEKNTEKPYNSEETFTEENILKCASFIKKYILMNPEITSSNRLFVAFYGGECLLAPNIIRTLAYSLKPYFKKISFFLYTNGYIVSDRLDLIYELNSLENIDFAVRFSFDYYLQNIQRKQGTHDIVLKNIRKLIENYVRVETVSVLDKGNNKFIDKVYDEYKEFYDSLKDEDKPYFFRVSYSNNCFNMDSLKEFDFSAIEQFEYVKRENAKNLRPPFHKLRDEKYSANHSVSTYIYNVYPSGEIYISEASRYTLDKNGKPYDFCIGNFFNDSCSEIIKNQKKYCEMYMNDKDILKCSSCEFSDVCKYQPWKEISEDYCKVMEFLHYYS